MAVQLVTVVDPGLEEPNGSGPAGSLQAGVTAAGQAVRAALRGVDLAGVDLDDLLDVLEGLHQVAGAVHAAQTRVVAHVAAVDERLDTRAGVVTRTFRGLGHVAIDAPALVASRSRLSEAAACARVLEAVHQVCVTPRLVHDLAAGEVDAWRARVVTSELTRCSDDKAQAVFAALKAHYAARGGWDEPAGPLRRRVRRLIA